MNLAQKIQCRARLMAANGCMVKGGLAPALQAAIPRITSLPEMTIEFCSELHQGDYATNLQKLIIMSRAMRYRQGEFASYDFLPIMLSFLLSPK